MDRGSLKLSVDKAINENFMALFEMEEISLQVRPYLNVSRSMRVYSRR